MNSSFFRFAIAVTIAGFCVALSVPAIAFLGWDFFESLRLYFFGTVITNILRCYISYRFFYFKKVPVLFWLDLLFLTIHSYTAYALYQSYVDLEYEYNMELFNWILWIGQFIICAVLLISSLRKELLFVILAVGCFLLTVVSIFADGLQHTMLYAVIYFVQVFFQLLWIPIFYKEMSRNMYDELLDGN